MVGLGPSYQGCDSFDVCGVTCENAPSAVGHEGTTLNVGNDISSRIEYTTTSSNHGDTIVPTPEGCKVSSKRRPGRQVQLLSARRPCSHIVTIVIHYTHLSTE